ncbi:PEMT [Biomphalaria glabrata]|nr:PEMT [Biomphalaria glabrata]
MDPFKRAFLSCCGDTASINFSLLTMPEKLDIHFSSFWLWEAAVMLVLDPLLKPMIGQFERKYKYLSKHLGQYNSFMLYCLTSYLFSFWMFYSYHRALAEQPYSLKLTENKILILGYIFLLGGLAGKVHSYRKYGALVIMGGHYFDLYGYPSSKLRYDPYYHPCGTATLAALFGLALVRASLAGLLLHPLCIVSYMLSFSFENKRQKKSL